MTVAPPSLTRSLVRDRLLELDTGFAFVGERVPLGHERGLGGADLLFYQFRARLFLLAIVRRRPPPRHAVESALRWLDRELRSADDGRSLALVVRAEGGPAAAYLLPEDRGFRWSRWPPETVRPWLPPAEVVEELAMQRVP